jgi:hypothetical protein
MKYSKEEQTLLLCNLSNSSGMFRHEIVEFDGIIALLHAFVASILAALTASIDLKLV